MCRIFLKVNDTPVGADCLALRCVPRTASASARRVAFFNANIPQGARNGSCRDNVQPVHQFSPQDPFWADNEFQPIPAQQSGCGFAVGNYPNLVPLGGWNAQNVSFGYVDAGNGRVWFVDLAVARGSFLVPAPVLCL